MKLSQIPEATMALGLPLENDEQGSLCQVIGEGSEEGGFWLCFPISLGLVTPSMGGFQFFRENLSDSGAQTVPATFRNIDDNNDVL